MSRITACSLPKKNFSSWYYQIYNKFFQAEWSLKLVNNFTEKNIDAMWMNNVKLLNKLQSQRFYLPSSGSQSLKKFIIPIWTNLLKIYNDKSIVPCAPHLENTAWRCILCQWTRLLNRTTKWHFSTSWTKLPFYLYLKQNQCIKSYVFDRRKIELSESEKKIRSNNQSKGLKSLQINCNIFSTKYFGNCNTWY